MLQSHNLHLCVTKTLLCAINMKVMWAVSSTIGGVGMYLVHICDVLSRDSSKLVVVMAVSGHVLAG